MTFLVQIENQLIAQFYVKKYGLQYCETMAGCEKTVDHLPYRTICPKRNIVMTDKDTGEIIFDSEPHKPAPQKGDTDGGRDLPATEEAGQDGDTGGPGHQ